MIYRLSRGLSVCFARILSRMAGSVCPVKAGSSRLVNTPNFSRLRLIVLAIYLFG